MCDPVFKRVIVHCSYVPCYYPERNRLTIAREQSRLVFPHLFNQHGVIICIPGLTVNLNLFETLQQVRQQVANQGVKWCDHKIDEAFLYSHPALRSSIANRRDFHSTSSFHIPLQEKFICYSQSPLLCNFEWLEHISSVCALDDDLHKKEFIHFDLTFFTLVFSQNLLQTSHVISMSSHVGCKNDAHHYFTKVCILFRGKAGQQICICMKHQLKSTKCMVLL
mmetsp:Transcript_43765/g.138319  ORF Transcript_43765/g.138319 Transcript_43765/m.138319 type:complete len:222 (+) Transcript_43765:1489-2154(+)